MEKKFETLFLGTCVLFLSILNMFSIEDSWGENEY